MAIHTESLNEEVVNVLCQQGNVVLRTDTIYGIVARATSEAAVEKVYRAKGRTPTKSPIVLIANPEQMFDTYGQDIYGRFSDLWPGKNSIILPSTAAPEWIVRGNGSVAYRIPDNADLREMLKLTGPVIAPSANPEGLEPAMDVLQAEKYFGELVDLYVDGGVVEDDTPSRLFRFHEHGMERLR